LNDLTNKSGFLQGGGEMGELMRRFNWADTSLGNPEEWPLSLRTTVGIILHSAFPMFLFWGEELLCFYNDAYRPSLGIDGKHPLIAKKGKDAWPEIWDFIGPIITQVLETGEAVWYEDQLLPIYRNGRLEDVYWTFSYSAAYGDDGRIEGVFVTCTETTDKVTAIRDLKEEEAKFRSLIEEAPVATCLLVGREMRVEIANEGIIQHWGKGNGIVGKTVLESLPELEGQPFLELLDKVFTTGKTYEAQAAEAQLVINGKPQTHYFHLTYKAVRNSAGEIYGVLCMSVDVTLQVLATRKLEKSQEELLVYFEQAPVAIATISKENLTFRLVNTFYGELVGRPPADIENKPLLEALPELTGQGFDKLLQEVIDTGIPFIATEVPAELKRKGQLETIYVNLTYQPQRGPEGEITGILVVATDVTGYVLTKKALEDSKEKLEFAIDATELGTWELNPFTNKFRGNDRLKAWFGLLPEEEIELSLATNVIAASDRERVNAAIAHALTYESGGRYDIDYTIQNPKTGEEFIVKAKGKAFFNEKQQPYLFSGTLQDVTSEATIRKQLGIEIAEQKIAQHKLEESELFSHSVIFNSPVAKLVFTGAEMKMTIVNENMLQLLGRDNSILGQNFADALPELAATPLHASMMHVFLTGETYIQPEEKLELIRFGVPYTGYFSYIYKALRQLSGEIYGIIVTATEVTEQVTARQKIEVKEKELRDLISAAPIGICVLSGNPARAEEVNDRFLLITGKPREHFQKKPYWEVLYEVASIFEPVLDEVFATGIKYTGEEHEMVLVRDGIPENIFVTFEYVPVLGIDGQVAKVIILAIEVTHQVETRKRIEAAVAERTRELAESNLNLKRSNAELEQFAYIASHDLQEPVRKISTFTQMLENSIVELSDQSRNYISKIYGSTDRMANLIRDVLAFSQITQSTDGFEEVDLTKTLQAIETDFELRIAQTGATVEFTNLPVLSAISSQMTQLFSNLMSNALKYIHPDVPPVIHVTGSISPPEKLAKHPQLNPHKSYHHITFSDNGIGFDQEHADRIFKIFQRLHGKTEFEGTGIGLSICRKIVQSHQGHISAAVGENGGAVFHILLPER
jgi:PAS domain S-box-containing protein